MNGITWHGGVMVDALDSQSRACGLNFQVFLYVWHGKR